MRFERTSHRIAPRRTKNHLSWRLGLGTLIAGLGYGTLCNAHSSSPVHITAAKLNPGTGNITVSGKWDCSGTALKGPIDIIATVEEERGEANTLLIDESFEPYAIGIAVIDGCRDERPQTWSVSVGALHHNAIHSGSMVHCAVTLSPRKTHEGDLPLISTETDRRLGGG